MSIANEQKLIDLEHRLVALEDEVREMHQTNLQRLARQAKDELDLAQSTDGKTLKLKRG